MVGTDVPAIDGPAGQERGQEAADAAVVVAEGVGFVEGDGLPGGDLVAWQAIWSDVTVATVASFDTWAAFSGTRALWGAISMKISVDML